MMMVGPITKGRPANWIVTHRRLLTGACVTVLASYAVYRVYNSENAKTTKAQLAKLRSVLSDYLASASAASSTVSLVTSDLQRFLSGSSDEVPESLRQLTKLLQSNEMQCMLQSGITSIVRGMTIAVTPDPLLLEDDNSTVVVEQPSISSGILEAVFSERGHSLLGLAVGMASKSATTALCEFFAAQQARISPPANQSSSSDASGSTPNPPAPTSFGLREILDVMSSEQGERVMKLLVTKSIRTAISTYLEASAGYNTYEDMLSSLANPAHRDALTDVISRCSGVFCREVASAYRRAGRTSSDPPHQNETTQHPESSRQPQAAVASTSTPHPCIVTPSPAAYSITPLLHTTKATTSSPLPILLSLSHTSSLPTTQSTAPPSTPPQSCARSLNAGLRATAAVVLASNCTLPSHDEDDPPHSLWRNANVETAGPSPFTIGDGSRTSLADSLEGSLDLTDDFRSSDDSHSHSPSLSHMPNILRLPTFSATASAATSTAPPTAGSITALSLMHANATAPQSTLSTSARQQQQQIAGTGSRSTRQAQQQAICPPWMMQAVELLRERDVRSLVVDVAAATSREATRGAVEGFFAAGEGSSSLALAHLTGLSSTASLHRIYMLLSVVLVLFLYILSPASVLQV